MYVKDAEGIPIQGLAAPDFEAEFHRKPVNIRSATPDSRPHRVVILLDSSASMAFRWEQPLNLAIHAVDTLPASTQVALLVFGTKIQKQIGFSAPRHELETELRAMDFDRNEIDKKVHGTTALYDALLSAIQLLGSPTDADVLYVVTDAGDNSSRSTPKDVAKALTANGVHLFISLLFRPFVTSRSPEFVGALDLNDLIHKVGGEFVTPYVNFPYDPKNPQVFDQALRTFELSLVKDYMIEIKLPEPALKSEDWTLKLSKEKREKWKNARVLYGTRLAPCQE